MLNFVAVSLLSFLLLNSAEAKTQADVEACVTKNRQECFTQCSSKIPSSPVSAAILACLQADPRPAIKACYNAAGIADGSDCVLDAKHNKASHSKSKEGEYAEAKGKLADFLECKKACKAKQTRCDEGCTKIQPEQRKIVRPCFKQARQTAHDIKTAKWSCINQAFGIAN